MWLPASSWAPFLLVIMVSCWDRPLLLTLGIWRSSTHSTACFQGWPLLILLPFCPELLLLSLQGWFCVKHQGYCCSPSGCVVSSVSLTAYSAVQTPDFQFKELRKTSKFILLSPIARSNPSIWLLFLLSHIPSEKLDSNVSLVFFHSCFHQHQSGNTLLLENQFWTVAKWE